MAFRHAVTPALAALRLAPVIVAGMVTVTLGELVGEVVLDVTVVDGEVALDRVRAVRLFEGGIIEVSVGARVVVTADSPLPICAARVVGVVSGTVEAVLIDVIEGVVWVGSVTDESTGPLLFGAGVAVELHAASESVTAATSPARRRLMLCTSLVSVEARSPWTRWCGAATSGPSSLRSAHRG
jgi:hypothetical protein